MHTIFEVFIESVTILLLFHISVFWPQDHEGPYPLALEGRISTTGPPGESPTLRRLGGGECDAEKAG